ncbi:MAG: response regulator [Candidatus Sericytochromatia bacterium]|nr:response regulator [Candidatus Sericytochromatia bacterium]
MARILLADDDRHFAAVVARFLGRAGHEVLAVADGEAALAAIPTFSPEALVLDVSMPALGGDALAARVTLPILFLSGRDLDRVAAQAGPRVRCLAKPADLDEILAAVEGLLAAELRPSEG